MSKIKVIGTLTISIVLFINQIYAQNVTLNENSNTTDIITNTTLQHQKRCEKITVPMCRGLSYDSTRYPNSHNHETQEEAGLVIHQFWPLVTINCSPDLKFFLCSIYVPICMENYHRTLPPCRSVCERARSGCSLIMQQYGFQWPESLACANFPRSGDTEQLCVGETDSL